MRKGRFQKAAAKIAQRYAESVSFDHRLYPYDIAGSIAHAAALAKAGIISAAEQKKIETGLRVIEQEIESGKFQWDEALEDAHMNIESALTKKIGEAGAKLHTARSNDQVALDLRLYVKEQIEQASALLKKLQRALLDLAMGMYLFASVMIVLNLAAFGPGILWNRRQARDDGSSFSGSMIPSPNN
jgi:argininosuccinate lyase